MGEGQGNADGYRDQEWAVSQAEKLRGHCQVDSIVIDSRDGLMFLARLLGIDSNR